MQERFKHQPSISGLPAWAKNGVLLVIAITLGSCADDFIDPFSNEGRYFTVYGYIDAGQIEHKIRVIPVTRHQAIIEHPSDIQAALDAEVTLTDLTTGEVIEWVYGLEALEDRTFAHVFTTQFVVHAGRDYRLDVTRSDGVRAWAITEVPYISDSAFYQRGPISFSDDSSQVTQNIVIPGDINPWRFEAIYLWTGDAFNRRVFVPYGRRGAANGATGWTTTMSLSDDQDAVNQTINESMLAGSIRDDTPLILAGAGLRMSMLDVNWQLPEGSNDIDIAFPDRFTNINNGYGFFGSIGYYVQEWDACNLSAPLGYEFAEANCNDRDSD